MNLNHQKIPSLRRSRKEMAKLVAPGKVVPSGSVGQWMLIREIDEKGAWWSVDVLELFFVIIRNDILFAAAPQRSCPRLPPKKNARLPPPMSRSTSTLRISAAIAS